jgi:heme exporter protein D
MIWQSTAEFWAMGGYGVYVWGSMGVGAALMALEVWLARIGYRQALDAVCEAMEAEALDAETQGAVQPSPARASHPVHFTQGSAS